MAISNFCIIYTFVQSKHSLRNIYFYCQIYFKNNYMHCNNIIIFINIYITNKSKG